MTKMILRGKRASFMVRALKKQIGSSSFTVSAVRREEFNSTSPNLSLVELVQRGHLLFVYCILGFTILQNKQQSPGGLVVSMSACHTKGPGFDPHQAPWFIIEKKIHHKPKIEGMWWHDDVPNHCCISNCKNTISNNPMMVEHWWKNCWGRVEQWSIEQWFS